MVWGLVHPNCAAPREAPPPRFSSSGHRWPSSPPSPLPPLSLPLHPLGPPPPLPLSLPSPTPFTPLVLLPPFPSPSPFHPPFTHRLQRHEKPCSVQLIQAPLVRWRHLWSSHISRLVQVRGDYLPSETDLTVCWAHLVQPLEQVGHRVSVLGVVGLCKWGSAGAGVSVPSGFRGRTQSRGERIVSCPTRRP